MTVDKKIGLPFSVDRKSPRSLVEQVEIGVRQSIALGRYKGGDIIPTTREMSELLGVSRIVTRQAVRRLADGGYLAPRPGVGCVVLGRGVKLWKGNVLLVMHGAKGFYYSNAFADELTSLLAKEGWQLVRVLAKNDDLSLLDLVISHGADFALVMFENEPAMKRLRRADIPFASVGVPVRGAAFHVHYRREAALQAALGELAAAGVKTAWQIGFEPQPAELDVIKRAGFVCREIIICRSNADSPCRTTTSALTWFLDVLHKGTPALPDFIYFSDDAVCQGALLAFLRFGVRIPDDMKVMSWSNDAQGPYTCDPIALARISTSENAAAVAANLTAFLNGKKFTRIVELETRYVPAVIGQ